MSLAALHAHIEAELAQTDALIQEKLQSGVALTAEIGSHITKSGGKRLRPSLTLLSGRLLNYEDKKLIQSAAIIELIHTATLLHDDVIDNSELRRGHPTANAVWGNQASVLVGDFLYSRAFQMLAELADFDVFNRLAKATLLIAEGEILQLQNCHNPDVTQEQYRTVIDRKTGTLFASATETPAILAKKSTEQIEALSTYGRQLGSAFQLVDDALDYCANTQMSGKNIGDDLAEGKPTLPLIRILECGTQAEQSLVRHALQTGNREALPEILSAIERTQSLRYTREQAAQSAMKAIAALAIFPDSVYKSALIDLAQFSVSRDF